VQAPNWPNLIIGWVAFIKVSSFVPLPIAWITTLATVPRGVIVSSKIFYFLDYDFHALKVSRFICIAL